MRREIKFRAWDKSHKKMLFFDPPQFDLEEESLTFRCLNYKGSIGGMDLMQFTGLRDKNGVEIYEGDTVAQAKGEPWQMIFTVGWHNSGWWIFRNGNPYRQFADGEHEVIGNIYESEPPNAG